MGMVAGDLDRKPVDAERCGFHLGPPLSMPKISFSVGLHIPSTPTGLWIGELTFRRRFDNLSPTLWVDERQ
jgi:hypothetical protein